MALSSDLQENQTKRRCLCFSVTISIGFREPRYFREENTEHLNQIGGVSFPFHKLATREFGPLTEARVYRA